MSTRFRCSGELGGTRERGIDPPKPNPRLAGPRLGDSANSPSTVIRTWAEWSAIGSERLPAFLPLASIRGHTRI